VALKIAKTFQLKQPVEKAWVFLSDPRKVAACVPGARITEQIDAKHYTGTISVDLGPSVTDYKGELEIVNPDAVNHSLELFGQGHDVKGRDSVSMKMTVELHALAGGGTEVTGVSDLTMVGKLAQIDARIINEVSNILFGVFTKNLQERMDQPDDGSTPVETKPISGSSLAWQAVKGLLGG